MTLQTEELIDSDNLLQQYEEIDKKSQSINSQPLKVYQKNDSVDLRRVQHKIFEDKLNSIDKLTKHNNGNIQSHKKKKIQAFFPKQHFFKENYHIKKLRKKQNLQGVSPRQNKLPTQTDLATSINFKRSNISEIKPAQIIYPVNMDEVIDNQNVSGVWQRKIQGIKQRETSRKIIQNQSRQGRSVSKKNFEIMQQKIQAAIDMVSEAILEVPKGNYGLKIQRLELNEGQSCFIFLIFESKVDQLQKVKLKACNYVYQKFKNKLSQHEIVVINANSDSNKNQSKRSFSKTPSKLFFEEKSDKRNPSKSVHVTLNIQKKDSIFQSRLSNFYHFINNQAVLNGFQIKQKEDSLFYYYKVGKGNNSTLVRKLLKQRWWWQKIRDDDEKKPNLLWTQIKVAGVFNTQCTSIGKQQIYQYKYFESESIQVHNHLEFNFHLGNKKAFFHNIRKYYELIGQDPFQNIPLTYHICKGENDPEFIKFLGFFNEIEEQNRRKKKVKNVWIVKPGENTNRGNGISIYDNIEEIKNKINKNQGTNGKYTYIIQQYIQKPFLYLRRKFDIRCYMLVTSLNSIIKAYWYQDGYIRTSSVEYNLKGGFDPFIHLTNDAVQKKNQDTYGKYESGNKVSFQEFQRYLDQSNPDMKIQFQKTIFPQMKQLATDCIKSVYTKIDTNKRLHNFEVFGLDFMLDINLKPYIIEVNTNPCLELSCPLLERIIPTMLENAFWIALDPIFPPPQKWPLNKRHTLNCNPQENNKFEQIFDEMIDGNKLEKLYEKIKEIKFCFDDFEESEIQSETEQ